MCLFNGCCLGITHSRQVLGPRHVHHLVRPHRQSECTHVSAGVRVYTRLCTNECACTHARTQSLSHARTGKRAHACTQTARHRRTHSHAHARADVRAHARVKIQFAAIQRPLPHLSRLCVHAGMCAWLCACRWARAFTLNSMLACTLACPTETVPAKIIFTRALVHVRAM